MPFNHYVKIKNILETQNKGWIIKRINKSTVAKNFKGKNIKFDHYYRIYDNLDKPIKYCKFQQIERLSQVLKIPVEDLPIIEDSLI